MDFSSKTPSYSGPKKFEDAHALRAARASLFVSIVLLALKFWAYKLTHSQAVYSDALETIINVVASGLAIIVLNISQKPADLDHPYGHGKVEFFSAAFEGGLIAFASTMICVASIQSFFRGPQIDKLDWALWITIFTGIVNALLGLYLMRVGHAQKSPALEASGHHVLSDFWTSAGVVVALLLVKLTGIIWIDPLMALIVGLYLGWTGIQLVRRSIGGLMDSKDRSLIEKLCELFKSRPPGIIQVHHLRVLRSGKFHHIDAHCVVPEFWDVSEAHEQTEKFEQQVMHGYDNPGELHLHVDPCRKAYCKVCDLSSCQIREQKYQGRHELTFEELINPEEPSQFL